MKDRLAISLCGIPLRNPVLAASGTFGYGVEFEQVMDLNAIGGIVVKGLSREPIEGNPPPRVWEARGGMINSIGLQNIGVRAFVVRKLPVLLAKVQLLTLSTGPPRLLVIAPALAPAESEFESNVSFVSVIEDAGAQIG